MLFLKRRIVEVRMKPMYSISVGVSFRPQDGTEESRIETVQMVVDLPAKPDLVKIMEHIQDQINALQMQVIKLVRGE